MEYGLDGLTVVVTGAAGEIGAAISKKLGACGARLVLWDIDAEGLQRLATETGATCHTEQVDLTDEIQVLAAADCVEKEFGGADILVNSAGIVSPHQPVWETGSATFRKVVDVNLTGVFHCLQAFVPQMQKRQKHHGRARIVNLASYLGSEPQGNDAAYAASKAGLVALTKSLSRELAGEGILVNCVAPTVVDSEMGRDVPAAVLANKISKIPLGRLVQTEDVAAMVAWLCSTECTFSTGAVFDVTGGRASH